MTLNKVEILKRAIRRLPLNSSERIFLEKELFNAEAGIRGEKRLRKKFVEFYSPEPFEILWNTSLSLGEWPIQIDGLLLTPQAAIIIESKNISGELHFNNQTGEFYRIDITGIKTVMDNPAVQVEKHIRFMKSWFAKHNIRLPVDGLLVFTALQSELCSLPRTVRTCRHPHMIEFLFKTIKEYRSSQHNKQTLAQYKKLIESKQTPYLQKPVTLQYSLNPNLFEHGIYCEACKTMNVKRQQRNWQCSKCDHIFKDAAEQAVLDYFALFGNRATNQELRNFLGINDRHIVKRLLSKNNFTIEGGKRHSKYSLSKDEAEI